MVYRRGEERRNKHIRAHQKKKENQDREKDKEEKKKKFDFPECENIARLRRILSKSGK